MKKTTRQRLLEKTSKLFAERGYQSTTLDDIARAVGIGPSAVYKHFAGKLDLYRAVLEMLVEPFFALFDQFEPDVNAGEFAQRLFRYHVAHPALARLTLHASLSGGEQQRLLIDIWYRPFYEKTAARIRGSRALASEAELIPSEFMAFNNLMLGYINLARLHTETLGVDPFSARAIEDETELLQRFAATLLQHSEAKRSRPSSSAPGKRSRAKTPAADRA